MIAYYAKLGRQFFLYSACLLVATWYGIKTYTTYNPLLLLFFGIGALIIAWHLIFLTYFKILKKPIFIANKVYLLDRYKNTRYDWADIDEVIAGDTSLSIKLYRPEQYIARVKNPLFRLLKWVRLKVFNKKPNYWIDLRIIDIEKGGKDKFLKALNECSI